MTVTVKHAHQTALPNDGSKDVSATAWNEAHTLTGLGTAAEADTGTSGATVPLLSTANTWTLAQTFTAAPVFTDQAGTRTALGLGTAATQNTGTSGANVPLLSTANTWSLAQTFSAGWVSASGATPAGSAYTLTATAPAAITTAQAGVGASFTASNAVAGSSVAGAAAGGSLTLTAGDAARLTSGNANGGNVALVSGAPVGTGTYGLYTFLPSGKTASTSGLSIDASGTQQATFKCADGAGALTIAASAFIDSAATQKYRMTAGVGLALASDRQTVWSSTTAASGTADLGEGRNAAGVKEINNGTLGTFRDLKLRNLLCGGGNGSYVQTPSMTVANLAAAATAGAGARAFVTDANSTTFGAAAVGGGANKMPVYSDGASWLIG